MPNATLSTTTYTVGPPDLNSSTSTYIIGTSDLKSSTSTYTVWKSDVKSSAYTVDTSANIVGSINVTSPSSEKRITNKIKPNNSIESNTSPVIRHVKPHIWSKSSTPPVRPIPSLGSPTHSRNSSKNYVDNEQSNTDGTPDRFVKRNKIRKKRRTIQPYCTGESPDSLEDVFNTKQRYSRYSNITAQKRHKNEFHESTSAWTTEYSSTPIHYRTPPKDLTCPLSGELLVHPVIALDGITYERDVIRNWLGTYAYSPVTQITMTTGTLKVDNITKIRLKKWRKQQNIRS